MVVFNEPFQKVGNQKRKEDGTERRNGAERNETWTTTTPWLPSSARDPTPIGVYLCYFEVFAHWGACQDFVESEENFLGFQNYAGSWNPSLPFTTTTNGSSEGSTRRLLDH